MQTLIKGQQLHNKSCVWAAYSPQWFALNKTKEEEDNEDDLLSYD